MEQEDAYLTHVPDENGVPQAPEDGGSDDSDEETEPEDLGDAGDGEPAGAASASSVEGVRRGRIDVWPFPMARKASPVALAHVGMCAPLLYILESALHAAQLNGSSHGES